MKHIDSFRKKIKYISTSNPNCVAIQGLENYMKKMKMSDYYQALDSYAYALSIGFIAMEIVDKNDETIGYKPCLKYYPHNVFGYEKEVSPLIANHFYTIEDCYSYLAKELIYKLRTLGEAKLNLN